MHNNLFIWILLIFFCFYQHPTRFNFSQFFHGSKCKVKKIFSNLERALNCLDYEPNEKFSFWLHSQFWYHRIKTWELFSKSNLLKLYQNFNVYYLISFNGALVPEMGSVLILANLSMFMMPDFGTVQLSAFSLYNNPGKL